MHDPSVHDSSMHAPSTAPRPRYRIAAEIEDYPAAVGRSTVLMGVLQTRNNARVLLSGSIDVWQLRHPFGPFLTGGSTSMPPYTRRGMYRT